MHDTTFPYARREALGGSYVIATYRVYGIRREEALEKCGRFAVGQTLGTWVKVPGITPEMIEHYQARVVGIEGMGTEPIGAGLMGVEGPEVFLLRVAFPASNFAGSFAAMLTGILGNDVSTSLSVRLLDLEFTGDSAAAMGYCQKDCPPIEKLRGITGVYGRPLLLNMIKPCVGFSPEVGAGLFREVALGGVDLIKDDELLANPGYCEVEKRAVAYRRAAVQAAEQTGKGTVYLPNITDRPAKMREHAKAVIAAGARACLINYVFTGLDAFSEICHEFGRELFVMGHYAGVGTYGGKQCGIAAPVYLGMLPRLAGADAVMTMYEGPGTAMMDGYRSVLQQRGEVPGIDKIVTAMGGGITPRQLPELVESLGHDVIIGIGGAIQGHPMGAAAGAKAAMAALDAAVAGEPLEEAACGCPELEAALRLWA